MFNHLPSFKDVIDGLSVGTAIATLAGWLPVLAALASLVWTLIRIFESATVQNWLHRNDPTWKPIRKGQSDES
jgi:hypothetical protein